MTCSPTPLPDLAPETAERVASELRAVADPLRLRMLAAIAADERGESCVCDLTDLTDLSQPTVSHHLKVLREAGLVASDRRGTWVWYRIAPERKDAVDALLRSIALLQASTLNEKDSANV